MNTTHWMRKKILYLATVSAVLTLSACGGGNDDDTAPSGDVGILFISNATNTSLNGWYGSGNVGLSGIKDTGAIGPNECAFDFDNFIKVQGDRTLAMMGDVRYAYPSNSTPALNGDNIKIKDTTYKFVKEGTNLGNAKVNLTTGTITFDRLLARDASNNSVELSGAIKLPDEASRDAACKKPVS